ncbi:MAG: hypothetical protein GXP27_04685, partial [Planctomycetes bacterium]|nr:hypothetical protein [Planctomycetota bacterium]
MKGQALGIMLTAVVVLLISSMVPADAQDDGRSLREAYQEAQQLARNPDRVQQAIAKYQAVLETHIANQETFRAALKELVQCYERSGQVEAGIRYFVLLRKQMEAVGFRDYSWREVLQFQDRNRELAGKVYRDLAGIGDMRWRVDGVRPSSELVESILQRKDKKLREQSLAKLREMLSPEAPDASKCQALATLRASLSAKFDRKDFLPLVRPLLQSQNAVIRGL